MGTSGSEGGTRHTYWVNGPYPTQRRVGGVPRSFWTVCGQNGLATSLGGHGPSRPSLGMEVIWVNRENEEAKSGAYAQKI
jgi:hypothetical protein